MVIKLYRDLIQDAQELENYERCTTLDDPDEIHTLIEEAGGYVQTQEARVEQEEIYDFFFSELTLNDHKRGYRKTIKMNIRNDFKRLYQEYLNANIKLHLSLPSHNIPIRSYKVENENDRTSSTVFDDSVGSRAFSNFDSLLSGQRNLITDSMVDSRIEAF